MTGSFLIDTNDLGEVEEALSTTYAKVRLSAQSRAASSRTRIWRTQIASLDVDDFEYSYDLSFAADPPAKIMLCRVLKGTLEEHLPARQAEVFTSGDAWAIGALDETPFTGFVHRANFTTISIDRGVLSEVASGRATHNGAPVRLTSSAPVSADASQQLVDVIDHVRHTAMNSVAARQPLLAGALAQYLAAAMLTAFPNTAVTEATIEDRHDSTPVLLRRAIAFIDDNAHTDISPADIATAANVTPHALLNMFRLHRDCTPMDYVRRVRLHYAHLEVVASDPETTSITEIAHRWGFHQIGIFMRRYTQAYGGDPDAEL